MSYIILRSRWYHIIALNAHAPEEDTTDDVKDNLDEELVHTINTFPKYHEKILLGYLNAKVGREDCFKLTIGNESLHKISNNCEVRAVTTTTSKKSRSQKFNVPTSHHSYIYRDISRCENLMSDNSGQQIVMLTTIW
jgi:hypothetical protein